MQPRSGDRRLLAREPDNAFGWMLVQAGGALGDGRMRRRWGVANTPYEDYGRGHRGCSLRRTHWARRLAWPMSPYQRETLATWLPEDVRT